MATKKSRQATRGPTRQSWPAWVWLALGVLMGLAISAVVLVKDWAPMLRKKNLPQPNPEAMAPRESEPAVADDKKEKPRKSYDFYQVLPEMEVVIPDSELSAKARAEAQARAQQPAGAATTPTTPPAEGAAPPGGKRYILQAGSYPDPKAADEIKAKLALAGYTAKVQPVTINGRTWHRVRLGPYSSASELETVKRALSDNGINAIALSDTGG